MYIMIVNIVDKSGVLYDEFISAAKAEPDILEIHETTSGADCVLKVFVNHIEEAVDISKRLARLEAKAKIETLAVSKSPKNGTAIRIPHVTNA
jgi:hypothetical protein